MQELINTKDFIIEEPTAVTIGKFDGRHRGHQKLLREMTSLRDRYGYKTAVFTFSTTPGALANGKNQTVITTNQERRNNLRKIGIDYLIEYPFTIEAAHMRPEQFVAEILVGKMNAKAIVVGTDCGFGYQRSGDVGLLKRLVDRFGYQLVVIDKAKDDDRDISSTYVREELDKGNIEKANELLGEPYSIHGIVVHGNHIGGILLGFPTANLVPPSEKHLPPCGVYVSRVLADGRYYESVTNIGKKPTVEGNNPVGVETHIFNLDADLYGKMIEVQLLHFLRAEQKFDGFELLKHQIEKDKADAVIYHQKHSNS